MTALEILVADLAAQVSGLRRILDAMTDPTTRHEDVITGCLGCFHPLHRPDACPERDRFGRCRCDMDRAPRFARAAGRAARALRRTDCTRK